MIAHNHIDQEELTLYALHFLSEAESEAILVHLIECTGCSENVALIRGDLAALAMTAEMHSPPASARQRFMTQVAREKKIVPIDRTVHVEAGSPFATQLLVEEDSAPVRSSGSKILPWVSWVGWAVAAGLTVSVVDLYREGDELRAAVAHQASQMASLSIDAQKGRDLVSALTNPDAVRVTLTQTPTKAVPQGHASYIPDKGSLIFTATNLDPLQPYKIYELWLIPADGHDPIPAGTFLPDARGNASVIMPQIPKGVVAKAFGITIEDQGGSLQPTLPIVMSGA